MPPRHRAQAAGGTAGPASTTATTSPAAAPASVAAPGNSVPSGASHTTKAGSATSVTGSVTPASKSKSGGNDVQAIALGVWRNYMEKTEQRTKLLDAFMAFLVVVGVLQFAYCVVGGNYPFNAFLSGFSATVGQFVLTASLRIQTNPDNKVEFASISHERAFADYVFGSLLLHFFCVNFIN